MKYTTTPNLLKEVEVIMIKNNVKKKDLAERLGKSQGAISSVFRDQKNISLDYLNAICDALGYDLDIEIKKRQ